MRLLGLTSIFLYGISIMFPIRATRTIQFRLKDITLR